MTVLSRRSLLLGLLPAAAVSAGAAPPPATRAPGGVEVGKTFVIDMLAKFADGFRRGQIRLIQMTNGPKDGAGGNRLLSIEYQITGKDA